MVAQITTSGEEWLDESLDESASPVWMPRVDAEALEAMRIVRQDSRSDAQLGAKQLNVAVCVGFAKPLLLKALRLFTPGRPGTDSFLDTVGFEMAAQLVTRSANVKEGDGVYFFNDLLHCALGVGDGHLTASATVGKVLKIASSAIRQMQGVVCGDGGDANLFRRCAVHDFGVWVIPCFRGNHANAVFVDFRSKVVFFSCTLKRGGGDFMQRVLAFVDLVMHAMHDSWSWDGWRCGDLHGPVDDTTNSCAVALLLIGLRLSRGVGVPIKWADGVLDLARDLFATHLLASASFAPRWGGSPDGETFVVRECWTWSAHSRSVVEGTLVCAVVYGGASLK